MAAAVTALEAAVIAAATALEAAVIAVAVVAWHGGGWQCSKTEAPAVPQAHVGRCVGFFKAGDAGAENEMP